MAYSTPRLDELLSRKKQPPPIGDISQSSGDQSHQEVGEVRRRLDKRDHHGRRRDLGHQPRRADLLHPDPDVRGERGR